MKITLARFLAVSVVACMQMATAPLAQAQPYPNKPIRMIVPFPPGGALDVMGRAVAQWLQEGLKQPGVVENRGGAGALLGLEAAARSAPDGYTLTMASNAIATFPVVMKGYDADLMARLAPVALLGRSPLFFMAGPSVSAKSLRELVDYAKANPGKVNYSITPASPVAMIYTVLKRKYGLDITGVTYQNTATSLPALLRGDVQMSVDVPGPYLPHIKEGRIRPLALVSSKRSSQFPDIPLLSDAGLDEFRGGDIAFSGVHIPAGTPRAIIDTLATTITTRVHTPAVNAQMLALGLEPEGVGPAEYGKYLEAFAKFWTDLAKNVGYQPE